MAMILSTCLLCFLAMWMTSNADGTNIVPIGPAIIAVEPGSSIEMRCRWSHSQSFQQWTYLLGMDNNKEITIYTPTAKLSENITNVDVKHSDHNKSSTVIINSTRMKDAGKYSCNVLAAEEGRLFGKTAELIVLIKPNCTVENVNTMQCSVSFNGNLEPTISWRNDKGEELIRSDQNLLNRSNSAKTLTSVLTVSENITCNITYSFNMFFNASDLKNESWIQSNAPEYNFTWRSSDLKCSEEKKQTPQHLRRILIGSIVPLTALVLLIFAIIFKRFFFGKKKKESVNADSENEEEEEEEEEEHTEENGIQPRNAYEIAQYAEIVEIVEVEAAKSPSTSKGPQFLRIERDGQMRLLAPDGTEYLEMNQVEAEACGPEAKTPEPSINPTYYVLEHQTNSVQPRRKVAEASYENVEINKK